MQPLIKNAGLRIFLYCLGFIIVAIFFTIPFIPFIEYSSLSFSNEMVVMGIFTNFIPFIFLTYLFARFIDRQSFESLGFKCKGFGYDFMHGSFLGIMLIFIGIVLMMLSGGTEFTNQIHLNFSYLLIGAFGFFLFAWIEEIIFRGYILKNLLAYNKYVALIISSLLFAVVHLGNASMGILPIINLFIAGILLGYYYIYKQNLWFPTGLHFTWNYFQGHIFGYEISGHPVDSIFTQTINEAYPNYVTGGNFGFEGSLFCTAIMLLAIVYIDVCYRPKSK